MLEMTYRHITMMIWSLTKYGESNRLMKDLYEKAFSHMTSQLDKRKDAINAEKDARLDDIDAQKEQYQHEIDLIDEQIKAKNKEIETIKSANEQKKEALNLQKAQYEYERMQNQRTNLVYTEDKGIIYLPDLKNIRDAKQGVDDAQMEITISKIEKETELLENQKEMWEEQIDLLDRQAEALEKYYDSMAEAIEKQKSKFEELQDLLEEAEMSALLKELGINEDAILSGSAEEFNKLRDAYLGILADLNKGNEGVLNALSELSGVSTLPSYLGDATYSVNELADSTKNLSDNIAGINSSNFTGALDNTAQSSSNAAEKVQNVTTALNNLSNDVANYQMPALNTDNFTSAFAEDGGIITALNSFMERYKEICDSIPDIWNNSLAEAFGQGGGSGDPLAGGLANDTKYDALFTPLIDALDNCKTNLESKLKECLGTFTTFQTDLAGVIGVGGGSEESGSSQSGTGSGKGKTSNGEKGSGGNKKSESVGGSDTIVGAIVEGGSLIDQALNGEEDSWSASFNTAKDSIHETATSIVDCIESMVETVVDACIKAIEAINMLASADDNNPNNATPSPYIRIGHTHSEGSAHVEGTAKVNGDWAVQSNENYALVGEIGRELIVRNGKYFTVGDNGAEMFKIQKGDIVFNHEQTESLLRDGHISGHGKAYADGTVGGGKVITADGTILYPLQPGDRAWEVQKAFEPFINKIISGEMELVNTAMFEHQKQMEEMAKQINYVNSITNNNRNVQQPIYNDIHVTLPNVTNATSAESLLKDLESIGRKKYQVNW